MELVAIMATYPGRRTVDCLTAARSIAPQVDRVMLVLNEHTCVPDDFPMDENLEYILPDIDLKDTGKFCCDVKSDDFVFLCDDDIRYPDDYVSKMLSVYNTYASIDAVVGVHGVVYSDFFDGDVSARLVHVFTRSLASDCFVNQLGTGTVACRGKQMPSFEFMQSSQRFVDLRFARHCIENKHPMVCVARPDNWLIEINNETSIFNSYTKYWDASTVREAQAVAGFRFLPVGQPADYVHEVGPK